MKFGEIVVEYAGRNYWDFEWDQSAYDWCKQHLGYLPKVEHLRYTSWTKQTKIHFCPCILLKILHKSSILMRNLHSPKKYICE